MITDARTLGGVFILRCDVCIVGAGPAGIAIACELGRRGLDVILLDSPVSVPGKFAESSDDGGPGGGATPEGYRLMGTSTTSWDGCWGPFDEVDFEVRDFVPHSGWPFPRAALDPYYERANELAQPESYENQRRESPPPGADPIIRGLHNSELAIGSVRLVGAQTTFSARFESELGSMPNVRVLVHAAALELFPDAHGSSVERVTIVSTAGHKLTLIAERFVLAGSGLEVTRLLLASTSRSEAGIGNGNDLLGRFYMCHVTHRIEWLLEQQRSKRDQADDRLYERTVFVSAAAQRSHQILNHRARLETPEAPKPISGTSRLLRMALGAATALTTRPLRVRARAAGDPPDAAATRSQSKVLRLDAEQAPNPESRLVLANDRDNFGMRRVRVDWQRTRLDTESLKRTVTFFDEALVSAGLGRARLFALGTVRTGSHHLGTTRMARDPKRGVVDENCRVHGLANLFVASSSVFPTSSYANPTLTVVALALRLADHLAETPGK